MDSKTISTRAYGCESYFGLGEDGYIWEQRYDDGKPTTERKNIGNIVQAMRVLQEIKVLS